MADVTFVYDKQKLKNWKDALCDGNGSWTQNRSTKYYICTFDDDEELIDVTGLEKDAEDSDRRIAENNVEDFNRRLFHLKAFKNDSCKSFHRVVVWSDT